MPWGPLMPETATAYADASLRPDLTTQRQSDEVVQVGADSTWTTADVAQDT